MSKDKESKDKEMLLNMELGSDSEEAIEEFKLPPPRKNQSKVRKNRKQLDTRVASGKSPLFTLKCIAVLILISVVISGCLLLSFFILNTQTQINELKVSLAKANEKIVSHTIEQTKNNEMLYIDIQQVKKMVNEVQQQEATLLEKIKAIEIQHNSSKDIIVNDRKILIDISSLKDGMANAGAETNRLRDKISVNQIQVDQLSKNVEELKQKQSGVMSTELGEPHKDFITRKEVDAITSDHVKQFDELKVEIKNMQTIVPPANHTENKENQDDIVSMKFIYELSLMKSLVDSLNISMNKKFADFGHIVYKYSNISNSRFESLTNDINRVSTEDVNRGKLFENEISQNMMMSNNLTVEVKNLKGVLEKFINMKNEEIKLLTLTNPSLPTTSNSLETHESLTTTTYPSAGNPLSTVSEVIKTTSNSSVVNILESPSGVMQSDINSPLSQPTVTIPINSNIQVSNSSDASKLSGSGFIPPFAPQEPSYSNWTTGHV